MQSIGEAMGSISSSEVSPAVLKGKRTKRRHRALPPSSPVVVYDTATTSVSSAESISTATREDEDMANCLILLARGGTLDPPTEKKFTRRNSTEAATIMAGKTGFYVYECKTCNKRFPSFQALGGHRTSHKKPKISVSSAETRAILSEVGLPNSMGSSMKPMVALAGSNNNGKNRVKVHECSICGCEFPSGQALGGHMRRHRMVAISPETHDQGPKGRNFLVTPDLNLPVPFDDDCGEFEPLRLGLTFAGERPIVFSERTALVDCHY